MKTDFILFIVAAFHLYICPFSKVEESFNLQAIHDILYLKTNFSEYDHRTFPGVVPRTFLGPLVTSALGAPIVLMIQFLELNKFLSQYVVRAVLGICVLLSLSKLKRTISHIFGNKVANWFTVITASQFHFMFYLSRTLPNVMALPLVLLALHWWIKRQYILFLWSGAAAVIIFRFELAMFFGFLVLFELFYRRITLLKVLRIGIPAALSCLALTVAVDSLMWQKLLWPEGEVLRFNVLKNRSHEYGTSPFLWYFYSAIPRGLAFSLIFVPLGALYDTRVRRLLIAPVLFVFVYSFLPHKELRFIIYVFPLFNVAAAVACARTWVLRSKSSFQSLLSLAAVGHLFGNILFTIFLLSVSNVNYPGGVAISKLHLLETPESNVSVHISNLAAQTGVSRFTQIYPNWRYDKTENLEPGSEKLLEFSHLFIEGKTRHAAGLKIFSESHDILDSVKSFSHVSFNYNQFPPVKVKTKPQLFILKKKTFLKDKKIGTKSSSNTLTENKQGSDLNFSAEVRSDKTLPRPELPFSDEKTSSYNEEPSDTEEVFSITEEPPPETKEAPSPLEKTTFIPKDAPPSVKEKIKQVIQLHRNNNQNGNSDFIAENYSDNVQNSVKTSITDSSLIIDESTPNIEIVEPSQKLNNFKKMKPVFKATNSTK